MYTNEIQLNSLVWLVELIIVTHA